MNYYLSLAALVPAVILFVRIYQLDHIEKEPRRLLGKLVLFGALAAVPAALAGCVTAVGGALLATWLDAGILRKCFGGFLLLVACNELFFKRRKSKGTSD